MENLVLYVNYEAFRRGVKDNASSLNFPWKLDFHEAPIIADTIEDIVLEGVAEEKSETETIQSANLLIEAGRYEDALDLLGKILTVNPNNQDAIKQSVKVKNWLRMLEEAEKKAESNQYETAVNIFEQLSTETPAGDGKQHLILKLNQLKKEWEKKQEALFSELSETPDFKRKTEIIDKLLEICPTPLVKELKHERELCLKKIEQKKRRGERKNKMFAAALMGTATLVIVTLFFFLKIKPDMEYNRELNYVKTIINTEPKNALHLIGELQRKKDEPEVRRLKEKATLNVKVNKSDALISEAEAYARKNDFVKAFAAYAKIKTEIFRGTTIPQAINEKESKLKIEAAAFHLHKAEMESDPAEKFIHYYRACYYSPTNLKIQEEKKRFLEANRNVIFSALINKATRENDCTNALQLVKIYMEVKTADPQGLRLREKIHRRCK